MPAYVRLFSLFILLICMAQNIEAQQLTVVDAQTNAPIADVYIYNTLKNNAAVTNANGRVDVAKFGEAPLIFSHPSYRRIQLTRSQLEDRNFTIALQPQTLTLDEIYVSAGKREQYQSEIPRKIRRVTTEDIGEYNPQTAADLLQASGQVFVQKSQLGGGSPMLRGFAANSVLLAVDGIRMNNAIFRSGNLQNVISVDPNALSGAEVIFGPGSIIYGSDALGGVMNFQTKDADLSFAEGNRRISGSALSRYASANNERTIHADVNIGLQQWASRTSITYSNFDDLQSGGNFYGDYPNFGRRSEYVIRENGVDQVVQNDDVTEQVSSGYEQLNLMQKLRYKPNTNWNAEYAFHFATTGNIPRYDRLIERENGDTGPLVNAEWYYGPQIWMMNTITLTHYSETPWFDKVTTKGSYQWFQESRNDRDFQASMRRNREENVTVGIGSVDFSKQWGQKHELLYGAEGIYNYVTSRAHITDITDGSQRPAATRYPDGGSDYTQLAAFAKYQYTFSPTVTAVGGVRYSHILLEAHFEDNTFYDFPFSELTINTGALNGSLGLTWRPADDLQFNLNGATGFRAPNVDDAAKVFDSEPGTVVVPNENLKPEYSYNADVAVIKQFAETARLEINGFYTWLRDAMVRRPYTFNGQNFITYDGERSRVEAVVNAGKAYIYGASAQLKMQFTPQVGFNSSITYTNGNDVSNNEPLRHVAPVFGQAGVRYKREKLRLNLYSEFNGRKDISDFSPSERTKTHIYTVDGSPGWATLNIRGSYRITPMVTVQGALENVFDQQYRPYSSGISAAGRNAKVSLRADW